MRRVLVIVLTFVLTVGASAWLILDDWNVAAWNAGQKVYYYRNLFRVATKRNAPPAVPLVVWMGDSTITNIPRPSYPQYLAPRFSSRHIASQVVAAPAFDFFTYYFLMGPVLDMHPDVIVMVAHLAAFPTKVGTRFTYNDLCSFIPAEALPGTMVLPLAPRRLSPARVLLARVLRTTFGADGFYVAEGLRSGVGRPRPEAAAANHRLAEDDSSRESVRLPDHAPKSDAPHDGGDGPTGDVARHPRHRHRLTDTVRGAAEGVVVRLRRLVE